MTRCYLCTKKKEPVFYWETPCLDHKYKHAKNCLKEGIHLACTNAVFFEMLSFEALAAAIKYSDYRNPTSIWWFARVSLNFNSKEAETDALTCLNSILSPHFPPAKWLGESERSLSKWKKLAAVTLQVVEQNKKKGKKQGDIVDLDRKIYHALKRKYGMSWSPIGGVLKKKTGNPLE